MTGEKWRQSWRKGRSDSARSGGKGLSFKCGNFVTLLESIGRFRHKTGPGALFCDGFGTFLLQGPKFQQPDPWSSEIEGQLSRSLMQRDPRFRHWRRLHIVSGDHQFTFSMTGEMAQGKQAFMWSRCGDAKQHRALGGLTNPINLVESIATWLFVIL